LLTDKINLHPFYRWYITLYVVITLVSNRNAKFSFCNLLIHGTILFGEMYYFYFHIEEKSKLYAI
jgi:hypothetical protein